MKVFAAGDYISIDIAPGTILHGCTADGAETFCELFPYTEEGGSVVGEIKAVNRDSRIVSLRVNEEDILFIPTTLLFHATHL